VIYFTPNTDFIELLFLSQLTSSLRPSPSNPLDVSTFSVHRHFQEHVSLFPANKNLPFSELF